MTSGDGVIAGNYLGKVVHFVVFMILSISNCYKYNNTKGLIDHIIWVIFFGLITEVILQFIPGRNMDIYDGIADTFGIIGLYLYRSLQMKFDKIILKLGMIKWKTQNASP